MMMPMEPALRGMLTQTITQAPYTGQDMYGKPSYGPPLARPAHIEFRVETLADQQGQERVSNTVVTCDGDVPMSLRDKVTLPDGTSPAIQVVERLEDPENPGVAHHFEIRL
jgi:hypothetical protein